MVEIVKKIIKKAIEEISREKRNANISAALSGKPKEKEHVIERSTVWERVRPLFLRGALIEEISDVTNFSLKQVSNAIYRRRPDWHSLPITVFSKERVRERKSRVSSRRPRRLDLRPTAKANGNNLEFSKRLVAQGLFGDDLSYWDRMVTFYKSRGRNLPDKFSDRLRLEVFLRAIYEARNGDHSVISAYQKIGTEVDRMWFDRSLLTEENFISVKTETGMAYREDEVGLYREDINGNRWRQLAGDWEGKWVFDTSSMEQLRNVRRNGNHNGHTEP